MIILIGADSSGKTTLARKFEESGLTYHHFDKSSSYQDYLDPLCGLKLFDAVCDRFIFCEAAYSSVMGRKFQYSMKEFHNIVLLTLMQRPVILFLTHKPLLSEYTEDQYLPHDKWDEVLLAYKDFLRIHHISHLEYDYTKPLVSMGALLKLEKRYSDTMQWWVDMFKEGWGAIGSSSPDVLLVAERLGPNNLQNLPFSHGPTGLMLTNMLEQTDTPLGKFAVTNMVKSFRRDPRSPNEHDKEFLRIELEHLKPKVAVFMGSVAKQHGVKVAKQLGIKTVGMTHFGYYSHKRITDISPLCNQWKEIIGVPPTKEVENGKARHRTIISST